MNSSDFSSLPDQAQLWVYGFSRPLGEEEKRVIVRTLDAFLPSWATHGHPVQGAYQFLEDRFVLLAGHLEEGISGCSIDSSVRNFKQLRDVYGLDGLNRSLVFYRDRQGAIQSAPFLEFQKRVDGGDVSAETRVFDTTIQTLRDLRQGNFERRFEESWHARSFPLPTVG